MIQLFNLVRCTVVKILTGFHRRPLLILAIVSIQDHDAALVAFVKKHGLAQWAKAGRALGRTAKECRNRWFEKLERGPNDVSRRFFVRITNFPYYVCVCCIRHF